MMAYYFYTHICMRIEYALTTVMARYVSKDMFVGLESAFIFKLHFNMFCCGS